MGRRSGLEIRGCAQIIFGCIDQLSACQAFVDGLRRAPDAAIGHDDQAAIVGDEEQPDILLECAVPAPEKQIGPDKR